MAMQYTLMYAIVEGKNDWIKPLYDNLFSQHRIDNNAYEELEKEYDMWLWEKYYS